MSQGWVQQTKPNMNPAAPRTVINPLDMLVYAPPGSDHLSFLPFPATLGYIMLAFERYFPVPSIRNWTPQIPAPPQPPHPSRYMSLCSMLGRRDDLLRWVAGQQHQTAVSRFALDQSARLKALAQHPMTNDDLIAWIENELAVRCAVWKFVDLFADACLTADNSLVLLTVYAGLVGSSPATRRHWAAALLPRGIANPNLELHFMAQAKEEVLSIFQNLRMRMDATQAQLIIDKVVPYEAIQRDATLLEQAMQSAHDIQVVQATVANAVQATQAAQFMQAPQSAQAIQPPQVLHPPRAVRPSPTSRSNHGAQTAQPIPAASTVRTTATMPFENATHVSQAEISHASAAALGNTHQTPRAPHVPNTPGLNLDSDSAQRAAEASQTIQGAQAE